MNRRGHLLIVSHVLVAQHGGELYLQGGFGRHLDAFAERFERVTILTCAEHVKEAPDDYRLRAQNVTVAPLPPFAKAGGRFARYLSMVAASLRAVSRLPSLMATADVLHPRLPSMVGMVGAAFSRRFKRTVVYYVAGDWEGALRAKGHPVSSALASGFGPLLKWLVSNGTTYTAGDAVAERLGGAGVDVIPVMTTALDGSHVLDEDVVAERAKRDPSEVLFVGAVWRMKGVHHFLGALPGLCRRFPDLRARMVGRVQDDDWFNGLVTDLGLEEVVTHHPHMAWDRLMEKYDESDVFVMPSVEGRGEGVPKVALEAMARGVPVVASDVGGIRALIRDGENGILVPPGDEGAIEEAVGRLWNDPSLRSRLATAGVVTAREYDLNYLIDRMVLTMGPEVQDLQEAV